MAVRHSLYGLSIISNTPIPGLPERPDLQYSDLRVHLHEKAGDVILHDYFPTQFSYISPILDANGQSYMRAGSLGDDYLGFYYADGARFAVKRDGSEVWANGPENYSVEDTATYLVGPVIGFVLRLNGILPLHACSVAVGDRAIALVGMQGSGKSTTAAAFAALGYPVLSEDVAALSKIEGRLMVHSGYPRVNLWPDSAKILFGPADNLPNITPTWGKKFLALDGTRYRFQRDPLPLGAIFILRDRIPDATLPKVEPISASSAMTTLVANTYGNYLLDSAMRRKEFAQLGDLLATTQVYNLWPPGEPSHIYKTCEAIAAEARSKAESAAIS